MIATTAVIALLGKVFSDRQGYFQNQEQQEEKEYDPEAALGTTTIQYQQQNNEDEEPEPENITESRAFPDNVNVLPVDQARGWIRAIKQYIPPTRASDTEVDPPSGDDVHGTDEAERRFAMTRSNVMASMKDGVGDGNGELPFEKEFVGRSGMGIGVVNTPQLRVVPYVSKKPDTGDLGVVGRRTNDVSGGAQTAISVSQFDDPGRRRNQHESQPTGVGIRERIGGPSYKSVATRATKEVHELGLRQSTGVKEVGAPERPQMAITLIGNQHTYPQQSNLRSGVGQAWKQGQMNPKQQKLGQGNLPGVFGGLAYAHSQPAQFSEMHRPEGGAITLSKDITLLENHVDRRNVAIEYREGDLIRGRLIFTPARPLNVSLGNIGGNTEDIQPPVRQSEHTTEQKQHCQRRFQIGTRGQVVDKNDLGKPDLAISTRQNTLGQTELSSRATYDRSDKGSNRHRLEPTIQVQAVGSQSSFNIMPRSNGPIVGR